MKIELISLFGINPDFERRTPPDLSIINNKTFNLKLDKLKGSKEFKVIWESSNPLLETVLANKNSKKNFSKAKNMAIDTIFPEQKEKLEQRLNNKKTQKTSLKMKR